MHNIKDIDIFEVGDLDAEKSSPWSSTILILRMVTDDGIVGYGEAPTTLMTLPVYEEMKELARIYKGKDATAIQKNYMEVYKHSFYLPVSMETTAALSAFEIASWDIVGKIYGMPVYEAFGGKVRDRVRAYANGWYDGCLTPEDFARKAKKVVAMGFTGMKFDPFGDAYDTIDSRHVRAAQSIVEELRKRFKDVDLMIEYHGRFGADSAIRAAKALEEFEPLFMEEPVHPDQFEGLLKFRKEIKAPVALGERVLDRDLFLQYLINDAADVLQPDITNCGGLLQAKGISDMAHSFGVDMAFHNAFGPIQTIATLNMGFAIQNLLIQESFEAFWPEWKRRLVRSGYKLENGYFKLDGKPGIGATVDERILEEYKVKGMEPFNRDEPSWSVKGTFRGNSGGTAGKKRKGKGRV